MSPKNESYWRWFLSWLSLCRPKEKDSVFVEIEMKHS